MIQRCYFSVGRDVVDVCTIRIALSFSAIGPPVLPLKPLYVLTGCYSQHIFADCIQCLGAGMCNCGYFNLRRPISRGPHCVRTEVCAVMTAEKNCERSKEQHNIYGGITVATLVEDLEQTL